MSNPDSNRRNLTEKEMFEIEARMPESQRLTLSHLGSIDLPEKDYKTIRESFCWQVLESETRLDLFKKRLEEYLRILIAGLTDQTPSPLDGLRMDITFPISADSIAFSWATGENPNLKSKRPTQITMQRRAKRWGPVEFVDLQGHTRNYNSPKEFAEAEGLKYHGKIHALDCALRPRDPNTNKDLERQYTVYVGGTKISELMPVEDVQNLNGGEVVIRRIA